MGMSFPERPSPLGRHWAMRIEPLEVYTDDSNYAIIKPPGRKYPGCVIQGDSLRIICGLAISVAQRVGDLEPEDKELLGELEELVHSLVGRLLHYQTVLQQHNIKLPYSQPVSEQDKVRLLSQK